MAAAVSQAKASSSVEKAIQSKERTFGNNNGSFKAVDTKEALFLMSEIPDVELRGNKGNCSKKSNMATSMIFRGGIFGDKGGDVGFIVYGSFEEKLQY